MDGVLQQPGMPQMPGMDPQTAGILAAAFQGLQASGPSRMPTSLGQIIGGAGQAGMGAYASTVKQNEATALERAHMELYKQEADKYAAGVKKEKQKTDFLQNEWPKYMPGGALGITDVNEGILRGTQAAVAAGAEDVGKFHDLINKQQDRIETRKQRDHEFTVKILEAQMKGIDTKQLREEQMANQKETAKMQDDTKRFVAGLMAQSRADTAANHVEPPVQTHTDSDNKMWERKRGGGWMPALGPDGKQLTTASASAAKNEAKNLSAAQAYDAVDKQITDLQTLIKGNKGIVTGTVGPKGVLSRVLETGRGLIPGQENAPTPALEAQSKKELIIGNIRTLLDSGHFSNQDKERIENALGTSRVLTTSGNAVRSLEGVREFVRAKKTAVPTNKPKFEDFFK